jgi:LPXTG-site transpeptidase (sortase) family protein
VRLSSVEIPRLGVEAKLVPLRLDDGALAGPKEPDDVGWYTESPMPGDRGTAVLVGHLDSRVGPAVFYRLGELRSGDLVIVRRSDGPVRFRVQQLARYRRASVPVQDVYGPTPDRELRLITCDGPYRSGRGYRDNVVVYALAE